MCSIDWNVSTQRMVLFVVKRTVSYDRMSYFDLKLVLIGYNTLHWTLSSTLMNVTRTHSAYSPWSSTKKVISIVWFPCTITLYHNNLQLALNSSTSNVWKTVPIFIQKNYLWIFLYINLTKLLSSEGHILFTLVQYVKSSNFVVVNNLSLVLLWISFSHYFRQLSKPFIITQYP